MQRLVERARVAMRRGAYGPRPGRAPGMRLWRKHAIAIALLVSGSLVLLGFTEMFFSYREAVTSVGHAQALLARELTAAVRSSLGGIERQLSALAALPWEREGWLSFEARREEFHRLLLLAPAVESVSLADAAGRERLKVSRRDADRIAAGASTEGAPISAAEPPVVSLSCVYGAIEYADDYEPFLNVVLSATDRSNAVTVARVNLRALVRELAAPLGQPGATVYAVNTRGAVVLHQDTALMLERRVTQSIAYLEAAEGERDGDVVGVSGPGLDGEPVIASSTFLPGVDWRVIVEQPVSLAMQPAFDTLTRTAAFTLIGAVLAMGVSFLLAGRLTRPIAALHRGAAELETGHFGARIRIDTDDELEALAHQFNRMAASLEESYAHLEQRVAEKTRDLELANRHKSEFLTNMSHELRTPLNAVIGFSDALLMGAYGTLAEDASGAVRDVREAGEHQLSLINDLLDLAKVEAGRIEIEWERIDVRSVVSNAATLVRERCARKRLSLVVEVDPSLPPWRSDARRLKQMLANLLSNAVKFTPPGGTVRVGATLDAAGWLQIAVADTGAGIDADDLPKLFREFGQLRRSGEPELGAPGKEEGTGLGLVLSRRFARLLGGDVSVTSRPGEGSVFTIALPDKGERDGDEDSGDR